MINDKCWNCSSTAPFISQTSLSCSNNQVCPKRLSDVDVHIEDNHNLCQSPLATNRPSTLQVLFIL